MPLNGFSVGRDYSLDIITPQGPLRLPLLTGFKSKQDTTDVKRKLVNGKTKHLRFPDGWSGSFEFDRGDSAIDSYFAQLEENYYSGLNEQPCTITETISEPDGSVSIFRFEGVLLKLDNAGEVKGDAQVSMQISFVAERRKKVS